MLPGRSKGHCEKGSLLYLRVGAEPARCVGYCLETITENRPTQANAKARWSLLAVALFMGTLFDAIVVSNYCESGS